LLFVFVPSFGYRSQYLSLVLCRVWPSRNKSRLDGDNDVDDEAVIMDHELAEFGLPGVKVIKLFSFVADDEAK
jgi:hypothetical protein